MNTLLVPIDFSAGSHKALAVAWSLAAYLECDVTVVHVRATPTVPVTPDAAIDTALAELVWDDLRHEKERLKTLRRELDRFLDGLADVPRPTRVVLRSGRPSDAIVQAADALDARMIVMSTHGRRGLARAFLGSTTEEVVRMARCPVLTLKPDSQLPVRS